MVSDGPVKLVPPGRNRRKKQAETIACKGRGPHGSRRFQSEPDGPGLLNRLGRKQVLEMPQVDIEEIVSGLSKLLRRGNWRRFPNFDSISRRQHPGFSGGTVLSPFRVKPKPFSSGVDSLLGDYRQRRDPMVYQHQPPRCPHPWAPVGGLL